MQDLHRNRNGFGAAHGESGQLQQTGQGAPAGESPYAGQEKRAIKSLSEQEITDYLKGRGMGTSKAADLNAHLQMREVLSPQQISLYDQLRGYEKFQPAGVEHRHH